MNERVKERKEGGRGEGEVDEANMLEEEWRKRDAPKVRAFQLTPPY